MRKGIDKTYLILHGWESREEKKLEEYENERVPIPEGQRHVSWVQQS